MGARSCLLHQIEQALQLRNINVDLRLGVPELRSLFKGRPEKFTIENLGLLLAEIPTASEDDLALWMAAPMRMPKKERIRSWEIKCKLKRSAILELHGMGIPAIHIAKRANIGVTRINQIIKEGKSMTNSTPSAIDGATVNA